MLGSDIHTIIFSNKARISFSEVILEESSSNSAEVQSADAECLMVERCGRSFLLPGMRMLAKRSSWETEREERGRVREKGQIKRVYRELFIYSPNYKQLCNH